MIKRLKQKLFGKSKKAAEIPARAPVPTEKKRRGISAAALARTLPVQDEESVLIARYEPPAGVIPVAERSQALAMDSTPYDLVNQAYAGNHFQGYQNLAILATLPEYRKMSEVPAKEMTRKWIKLQSTGGDKDEKIKAIEHALDKHKVKDLFKKAVEFDGLYGRAQIYIDVKTPNGGVASEDPEELKTVLLIDKAKIKKGALRGFKLIEPVWTYPSAYNSTDPLAQDYYRPSAWYVLGKTVHSSRLLTFVSREVPDLLKAAYNFGGLSMTQMAEPYVNNWTRTRDSVSDLLHSFSVSGIMTNMSSVLSGMDDAQFIARAQLFNNLRDNRGLMLLDKDTEEFFQFNTPLSGIHELQAQAQEHMSSVSSIPLVKFLGITPSGLNASTDGEIKVFYDDIASAQEALLRDPLKKVIDIIQLSEFGEIDGDITFDFESLEEMSDEQKANIRKVNAETDVTLIGGGVISPDESRQRIANDPDSGYDGLTGEADFDDEDEAEAAMDSAHWITVNGGEDPETGEHTGKRVLIDGSGKVIGGAGGKLNGKTFSNVKSKSKDVEKKDNTHKTSNNLTETKKSDKVTSQSKQNSEGTKMVLKTGEYGSLSEIKVIEKGGEFYIKTQDNGVQKKILAAGGSWNGNKHPVGQVKISKENADAAAKVIEEFVEAQNKREAEYKKELDDFYVGLKKNRENSEKSTEAANNARINKAEEEKRVKIAEHKSLVDSAIEKLGKSRIEADLLDAVSGNKNKMNAILSGNAHLTDSELAAFKQYAGIKSKSKDVEKSGSNKSEPDDNGKSSNNLTESKKESNNKPESNKTDEGKKMRTTEQAKEEFNEAVNHVVFLKNGSPLPYVKTVLRDVAKRHNITNTNEAMLKMFEEFDEEASKHDKHYGLSLYLNNRIAKINNLTY